LIRTAVSADLKKEVKKNQDSFLSSLSLQPADSALFLNGLFFDVDSIDAGALLESARSELRTMEGLYGIGIQSRNFKSTQFLKIYLYRCEATPDGLSSGT
jgi:UDP-glucose:glycoprotein glucosyltransferase